MPAVIGCDAHKQFSVFVRIDPKGKTSPPVRVEHHRQRYIDFLHTLPPGSEIALEATGHWYWMVDEMEKAGHHPHLANPTEAKKRMGKTNKTDALDAKGLAILLHNGTLPESWIPPGELRDRRELLRTRMALRDLRTSLKHRIHAAIDRYGMQAAGISDLFGVKGRVYIDATLDRLPRDTAAMIRVQLTSLDQLEVQIEEIEDRIAAALKPSPEVRLLRTIPGVGEILAPLIWLEIGEVQRFPRAENLASYAGLVPRIIASGEGAHSASYALKLLQSEGVLTISAPKSVSLTALVGGDDRVRDAHRESVKVALDEMEKYVQARIGGNVPAQTTGAWAVAKFEHDSSRPVDGCAAPQLHTHAVVFNVTETADGNTRALQPQELYKTQQYATAVYRSELATRLQGMGYEIERGEHGQPEIKGYSREYLEASSPRREQIKEQLREQGRTGPEAAEIAAHQTRDAKQPLSHEEVRERHQAMARVHGDQPQRVLAEAAERPGVELRPESSRTAAHEGVSYARERGMEREAVTDERSLMRDALKHTMGEARLPEIKAEFEKRVQSSELIEVPRREGLAGRAFTTGEMQGYERELIDRMKSSQGNRDVLAEGSVRQQTMEQHPHLSLSQRNAVDTVLTSRDQMMALEGVAGAGKRLP